MSKLARDSCKLVNCNACILGHRGTNFTSILNIKVYLQPNISTVKSQDEDISEVKTLTGLQINGRIRSHSPTRWLVFETIWYLECKEIIRIKISYYYLLVKYLYIYIHFEYIGQNTILI